MALERQSIEKKDFPIGRRGYDPEAVDAHLHALADEIEELKRSSRRRSDTLASAASEQVRAIVEAAETSAAEIQRQAEDEAQEIRSEANAEAQATREQAEEQAQEYVGRVSESTAAMLQRLDAMENELGALLESLRTGAHRLNADLQLLEGSFGQVRAAVQPHTTFEPEPVAPPPAPPVPDPGAGASAPQPPLPAAQPPVAAPSLPQSQEEMDDLEVEDEVDDDEGARLIALNMALNGTSRAETERYLAENFQLADRQALLDEVYASVEG